MTVDHDVNDDGGGANVGGFLADSVPSVHVFNMGTRNASDESARALFGDVRGDHPVLAFRIDSTLRGPIGASLGALLTARPDDVAFVVPAYPDSGRTTQDGIHYVHGTPVHETPAGNDPFAPVHASDLRVCVGDRSRFPFLHLPLQSIRGDNQQVTADLRTAIAGGIRVILCDAETNADIDRLAGIAVELAGVGHRVLPVDPGPFSVAFATRLLARPSHPVPTVLAISASVMHNARAQMDYLEHALGLCMVHYSGQTAADVIAQMQTLAARPRGTTTSLPISPATTLLLRTDTWQLGMAEATSVVHRLPDIVHAVIEAFPSLRGFYFSGGEAAATILRGVGVTTLAMEMEVAPLTTMSRPLDGMLRGAYVVTKGGAIGDHRAVVDALVRLHEAVGGM